MYVVVQTTHKPHTYSDLSDQHIVSVHSTRRAANTAAVRHFAGLHSDYTHVDWERVSSLLRILAEGGDDEEMTLEVEQHALSDEDAGLSDEALTEELQRVKRQLRDRARAEWKRQEEEDTGYDSYGKPIQRSEAPAKRRETETKKRKRTEKK